ncbi:hypothetical protein [Sigmofec virus UA08Rod_5539]|uniref:Uncharacterized protein n=1 Tax=Sigmofec virus UA08Rod_5539 TaxID=2929428 RepID=A0A976R597_9VIRU|nr:hypothetical protein [Sigmofec virus UA08Rod_5539]
MDWFRKVFFAVLGFGAAILVLLFAVFFICLILLFLFGW